MCTPIYGGSELDKHKTWLSKATLGAARGHKIWQPSELPKFTCQDWTGLAFADEALSYLYQRAFQQRPHCGHLEASEAYGYLTVDPFERGLQAFTFINKLYIRWTSMPGLDDAEAQLASFKTIMRLEFAFPVSFVLEFLTEGDYACPIKDRMLKELQEQELMWVVQELGSKGHSVTINYTELQDIDKTRTDVTGFYTMPRETWLQGMVDIFANWYELESWCIASGSEDDWQDDSEKDVEEDSEADSEEDSEEESEEDSEEDAERS